MRARRWVRPCSYPSAAVATAFPFLSASLRMERGILEGITSSGEPVILDWWAATQRNANRLLVAPSGSGKSFKAKLDLLRTHLFWTTAALRQREGCVAPSASLQLSHQQIVIDPEREYQRIAQALGGQWIRLALGSRHHLNPFDVPRAGGGSEQHDGDVLADHVQHLLALFDIMLADRRADATGTLSGQEKGLLDSVTLRLQQLATAFKKAGFSVALNSDMQGWLKTHAVIDACMWAAVVMTRGGSAKLGRTRKHVVMMIQSVREGLRALQAQGIPIRPLSMKVLFLWMPSFLAVLCLQYALQSPMTLALDPNVQGGLDEVSQTARDIMAQLQKSPLPTPTLSHLIAILEIPA